MNAHTKEVLELQKIINHVKKYAKTSIGKEIISNLDPVSDISYIEESLKEVTQAKELVENFGNPPLGGVNDLRDILKRVNKEMVLSTEEITKVHSSLINFKNLKNYFYHIKENEDPSLIDKRYFLLTEKGLNIKILSQLEKNINNCIDDHGNIKDDASPRLKSIRDQIQSTENKIREKLEDIIRGTKYQSMLQDALITKREDRYVVPIKHEYRNTFNGIVHDRSSSGMTIFMEPMVVVKLNNKLREIRNEEEAEIHRILQKISYAILDKADIIKNNLKISSILDVAFARAEHSKEINGIAPDLNKTGKIDIKEGRHPLLQNEPVPISIKVGEDFKSLVITGPNTGGKTVALKTVGLFVLMAEMGFHIPAELGSSIFLFKKVFADIGDEQSIEQNLSTFSSHMNKIKSYLNKAGADSLVLLDELGAGTDPKEGAALGISVLEKLKANDVVSVATTHYSQLKSYAFSTDGVQNASVEFDIETLQPTYKLIMGIPGGSNAFDIALKLGMPSEIIARAKELINSQELEVEEIIKDLNKQRKSYRELKQENERKNKKIKRLQQEYENKLESVEKRKKEIIAEAEKKAEDILKNTRKKTKKMIKELKEKEFISKSEIDRKGTEINEELKNIEKELISSSEKDKFSGNNNHNIEVGDEVRVRSAGKKGEVININKEKNEAVVQAGIMKVTAGLDDLVKVDVPETEQEEMVKKYKVSKSAKISPKIDLRGDRYAEAQRKLDKYLDDAVLAGFKEIEIVHGKGSGALREAVSEVLENNPHVPSYRLGRQKEGGTGVTIAEIAG